MKKAISMKPLALATAFAAGSTVSMIATALPGGDTLGAAGVVNESICQQSVDMTISGGSRSVTTGTGTCQLRTLPPTKGFVRAESSPAGGTVSDSAAMVAGGGEFYEAYVGGNRDAAVLLTPNRALATSRSVTFATGADGSMAFDLAATVQPSTGLQSSWLTGTYTIVNRQHNFSMVASGLEKSIYSDPNLALGERNYTKALNVTFNGNGTCTINDVDSHVSASLTMDPLMSIDGTNQMDVDCTTGGGQCGQNDGRNYVAMGVINVGSTATVISGEEDWQDADADGKGLIADSCTYSTAAGKVTVNYGTKYGDMNDVENMSANNWTVTYDVSSDLRYLVSDGNSLTDTVSFGGDGLQKGGLAVGVRTNGSPTLTGKTYLFNSLDATLAASTPATASYENPAQPVYQEEECISRGSLSLAAAGACTVDVVSTCTGRSRSGYEETTDGGADGTITDSLTVFDGTPLTAPTCSWSGSASNLTVNLGIQDPDGNPVTKVYTGSASDNGEALVLQGVYNVGGPTPDVDNPPLLPQQKFNMISMLVAQEYQGTLSADADADGLTNLEDFQWGNDQTPANAVRSDFNASGTSDIYMRSDNVDSFSLNLLIEGTDKVGANGLGYNSTSFSVLGFADIDGDNDKDVLLIDTAQGFIIAQVMGAGGAWEANVAVGYTDGSAVLGVVDNLYNGLPGLLFKSTGDLYYTKTIENGALTNVSAISTLSAPFSYVAMADVDGNGEKDLVMLNSGDGSVFAFKRAGNAYTGWVQVGGTSGMTIKAVKDVNNDGRADVVAHSTAANQIYALLPDATGGNGSYAAVGGVNADANILDVVDVDGDGDADIVVSSASLGQVYVMAVENAAVTAYNTILYATSLNYEGTGVLDAALPNDVGVVWTSAGGDLILSQLSGAALDHHVYVGTYDPTWIVHME